MSDFAGFWKPFEIEDGQSLKAGLGPLSVLLKRTARDLYFSVERSPDEVARLTWETGAEIAEDKVMRRLGFEEDAPSLQFAPALPPKVIIVRPEFPLAMLPGERVQFYISIPLWLQLRGNGVVFFEEPTVVLSKTWFGETTQGDLGFSLKTRAKRDPSAFESKPFRAICPLRVKNQADDVLHLERLCLRVQHLELYRGLKHFWTNDIGVSFRGDALPERVVFGRSAPQLGEQLVKAAEARDNIKRGSLFRSLQQVTSSFLELQQGSV